MELFYLLLLFVVVSLLQGALQKKGGRRGAPPGRPPAPRIPRQPPARREGVEAPQSIRDLFEEVRRSMEEAERRARGEVEEPTEVVVRRSPTEMGDEDGWEEEIEDRTSLEVEPEVRSLEEVEARPERRVVDLDEEAEAAVKRRIRWAEEHARGRTRMDHREFDERVRKPAAAPPSGQVSRGAELRKMLVWREILGKPVALRDD